jgi:hypothetical protein
LIKNLSNKSLITFGFAFRDIEISYMKFSSLQSVFLSFLNNLVASTVGCTTTFIGFSFFKDYFLSKKNNSNQSATKAKIS